MCSDPHFQPSGNILIILDDVPYVACIIFTTLTRAKKLYKIIFYILSARKPVRLYAVVKYNL